MLKLSQNAGGYEIATLSAGGVLAAIEAVVDGTINNAYCLVRPPGHHATRDLGMGFCMLNNIVLGAMHAKAYSSQIKKVAIVDYDVHVSVSMNYR
jgi:acetoin utilization deacetylase AcuC-like enzyme